MDKALQMYLASHNMAVNAAAVEIARDLANPADTDRDVRRLIRDSRDALREAIKVALENGPVEGMRRGSAGEVCVVIRVRSGGQGSMGKIGVSAARLVPSAMIPCPNDWTQDFPPPSGLAERLHRMMFPPPEGPSLVETDEDGKVPIGSGDAGVAYVMEKLPDGEVWFRPLETFASDKL